jgi:hypothetical protein
MLDSFDSHLATMFEKLKEMTQDEWQTLVNAVKMAYEVNPTS